MEMTEEQKKKVRRGALIDRALYKMVSRKLMVWFVATGALFVGLIDAESWLNVSMVYIGSETVINAALALKTGKQAQDQ